MTPIDGANARNFARANEQPYYIMGAQLLGSHSLHERRNSGQSKICLEDATPFIVTQDGSSLLTCRAGSVTALAPDGKSIWSYRVSGVEARDDDGGEVGSDDSSGDERLDANPCTNNNSRAITSTLLLRLQSNNNQGSIVGASWDPATESMLLFENNRADHGFVGIVHDAGASSMTSSGGEWSGRQYITWLAPDFYVATSPVWSPSSNSVAFIRYGSRLLLMPC